ncbi:acyl carrier protein [Marinactinospora rubrisoli]|uniref:Acyl carrier protein n=1 Tax=Marinactinospora rubrisoli TaxID=2715399 RepID=A0ABW2KNM1_9ACTN
MTAPTPFTLDDLTRILRECAGEDETVDLAGNIAEADFEQLGYDSLALMEAASRVSRQYDVALPEDDLADVHTPSAFVQLVNRRRAAA